MPRSDDRPRPRAQLRLVGAPALLLADGEVDALERKDAALLALLATAGATPRAALAALLWPDADADGARNNLRQRLFRLKRIGGDDLVTGASVLSLADGVVHDLAALPARLAADPQALAGELLGSFDYADCDELAAWVGVAREQWRAARRDALADLAARLEGERQFAQALVYAQRLVDVEPLREHAHRRVMRLHYLLADRAAALGAHEFARHALGRGLGVVPGAETERLAELIRSDAGGATPAARSTLPPAPLLPSTPRLIGREREWAVLADAVAARRCVLICGDAGIGKSRLSSDFAIVHGAALPIAARPGDVRAPYAVLSRLVRTLVPRAGPVALAGWVKDQLAGIVPELPGAAPAAASDTVRLQQAVVELLVQCPADSVSLVALDDLHFADEATLDMLPALARAPGTAWLLSVRSGAMPDTLARWCAAQDTEGPLVMNLGPLDEADIVALLESLAVPDLDPADWAGPLLRHTGGNPLFILETLRAMLADGSVSRGAVAIARAGPLDIGQLVERRLDQLPAPALKLARVAAIAGPDFSVALAAALLGQDALGIADAWRQLEAAHVMREHGFANDLVHEATLRSVPAAIAKAMHGEVATQLERQGGAAACIARHWFEAREFGRAGALFQRAADEALAASPGDERATLLARAADCIEQARGLEPAPRAPS